MICSEELVSWVGTILADLNIRFQVGRLWLCALRAMKITLVSGHYEV